MEQRRTFDQVNEKIALIAALPMFIFGLIIMGITIFLSSIGGPNEIREIGIFWHYLALFIGMASLCALLLAARGAIQRKLALWSYPWLVAILSGFVISMNLVLDDRVVAISQLGDIVITLVSLLACIIIWGYVALQGWQHAGLISIAFGGTLGLSLCFFAAASEFFYRDLGLLAAFIGLVEAALVYIFIRRSDIYRIAVLIGVAVINIAVAWQVEAFFRATYPSRDISQFWGLAFLLTGLLLAGTLSGVFMQFIGQQFNRRFSH